MSDKCECVGRCADKPETMTDIINDILGLALSNRKIITDMSNSFRRGSVEPIEDGKMPDLDKFDKISVIRDILRENNRLANNLEEALG